jgi:hypothetical protein
MEPSSDAKVTAPESGAPASSSLKGALAVFVIATIGLLAATIALAVNNDNSAEATLAMETLQSNVPDNKMFEIETLFNKRENACMDTPLKFDNVDCVHLPGPQAGANVTKGFVGLMEVDYEPNTKNYWQSSMCPVNVHWHLGTEHYSVGEYDEDGDGPHGNLPAPDFGERALAEDVRAGYRCHHYDADDAKFTTEYDWKHCKGMEVGETYEVHWPHSAAGACGEVDQYQTPFYDGVFCKLDAETFSTLGPQDIANAVGVQAQIYTIVNDEEYFYSDMMRGWIVDGDDFGKDIAYYTGSTTGTTRSNEICSQYTPITWQVDRKCHMISASSFDKLCYDMKLQRDDMTYDLHAHGSRELVKSSLVANNQQRALAEDPLAENKKESRHLHSHDHHHNGVGHHHHDGEDHHHHEWF